MDEASSLIRAVVPEQPLAAAALLFPLKKQFCHTLRQSEPAGPEASRHCEWSSVCTMRSGQSLWR